MLWIINAVLRYKAGYREIARKIDALGWVCYGLGVIYHLCGLGFFG